MRKPTGRLVRTPRLRETPVGGWSSCSPGRNLFGESCRGSGPRRPFWSDTDSTTPRIFVISRSLRTWN